MAVHRPSYQPPIRLLVTAMLWTMVFSGATALGVPMKHDPNGFEGTAWGSIMTESDSLKKVEDAGRLKSYELKTDAPKLGDTVVSSMRFTTVEDKLARVTVRYEGKEAHDQILAFLQSRYGPLDRTPGQFSVGPVKFYAWQGFDTEVTLRYELRTDHGIIFFESQSLRSFITEGNSPTVF